MENLLEDIPDESNDDHIPPYQYVSCHCGASIRTVGNPFTGLEWEHVMDVAYDHKPEPVTGTYDMTPPPVITNTIGHFIEYYYGVSDE